MDLSLHLEKLNFVRVNHLLWPRCQKPRRPVIWLQAGAEKTERLASPHPTPLYPPAPFLQTDYLPHLGRLAHLLQEPV